MARKALGRGLEALIPQQPQKSSVQTSEMDINDIVPNRNQPRKRFDQEELENLADSIRSVGIVEAIVLRRQGDTHTIIAGERRWRAAKLAGLTRVPVIIKDVDENKALEMALIENIQRADLNPIEEAQAYQILISKLRLRQEDLAQRVGKSRAAVANTMRLLGLPSNVQQYLIDGSLSAGHARALLSLKTNSQIETIAKQAVVTGMSVRSLEALSADLSGKDPAPGAQGEGAESGAKQRTQKKRDPELARLESRFEETLGTKVFIRHGRKSGRIEITYYTSDDLERIMEIICPK